MQAAACKPGLSAGALLNRPAAAGVPRRRRCGTVRAEGGADGGSPPGQPSRDEVLARINKAREYKAQPAAAPPAAPTAAAAAATSPPAFIEPASPGVEQAFNEAAQQLAAAEEAQFLQAISEAAPTTSSSTGSSARAPQQPPARAPAAAGGASREAAMARIAAARQYKPGGGSGSSAGGSSVGAGSKPGTPAVHPPPGQPTPAATAARQQQRELAAAQQIADQAEQQAAQGQARSVALNSEQQRSFRTGGGGADQAANFLTFAEREGDGAAAQIDSNLSAEQFTLAKEERQKQQEVEIITVDAGYARGVRNEKRRQAGLPEEEEAQQEDGQAEGGGDVHNPAVATWGVFPRPRNISEAYGGGRNLRPGQALESEEVAAERQARVAAALKDYRKTLGLDIDPAVEAEAQASYNEGLALFEQGLLTAALPKFEAASAAMHLRSRLGGEARLQQALCLDSLGRNQEAYDIYKKIESHTAPYVGKKAKRMLFGWKAAETLKTERLSYAPTSGQWKRYFDAINRNSVYSNSYVASESEEESGPGQAAAVAAAVAVVVLPLALVAWRILGTP